MKLKIFVVHTASVVTFVLFF